MHHHSIDSQSVLLLIASFFIQAGIWINDWFGTVTFHGTMEVIYDILKIAALGFSIWASYKVGKKHDK